MTQTSLPDLAPADNGHPWLLDRREAAISRAAVLGMPEPDQDDWRHSRIADLDLGAFAAPARPSSESDEEHAANRPVVEAVGEFAHLAVTYDGHLVHAEGDGVEGLTVTDLSSSAESPAPGLLDAAGADLFGELNTALAPSPVLVEVGAGRIVERPVIVAHWTGLDGAATYPRTIVRAGQGSQVTVVELWLSADVRSLIMPRTELEADRDAILRHVVVSDLGPQMWQIAATSTKSGTGADVTSATVALGGDYCRFRIDADLAVDGGEARLMAAYFADRSQVHDFRTLQDHTGKRTSSDLVFKGAVSGQARSVYSGLIRVNPGASATSAFLTNRNLVLSEDARAYSVPNLEIVNENDLRSCGHAATSGPLDADQIFYLESRGVPTEIARRLIVLGFFDDVVSRVPVQGLRDVVRDRVGSRLKYTEGIA